MTEYNTAQFVWYDDGTELNVNALITAWNSDGTLNLELHPESGQPWHENGVPQRAEGGGRTWHVQRIDSRPTAEDDNPKEGT
jgi:hypothetical protein